MLSVRCPSCLRSIEVFPDDLDTQVECPNCLVPFTPQVEVAARAKAALRGPANGLFWTGLGGMVLLPIVGSGFLWLAQKARTDPKSQNPDDAILIEVMGVALGILGFVYFLVLAIAAHLMKRGTSATWVYVAACLGVATIAVWGPCLPVTWAGLPYGLIAVLAMGKPGVRAAFRAKAERD